MTDRPDFLDDLENQLLDAVPALRRRRRRRRALAGVAGASLIVAAGLLATALFDDPRDGPEDVVAVSPTTTISGTAATGAPTTTQSPSPPGDSYAVGGPVVGFGPDGVVAQEAPGVTAGITPRPAARAHVFDTGLVAYQLAGDDGADGYPLTPDGPIVLERPDGETTTIEPEPGRELALLDAAVINDRATLLATSRVSGPMGPYDAEESLLVIEVDSGEQIDMGVVGGWESGVVQGSFTDDEIVLLRSGEAFWWISHMAYDGEITSQYDLASDRTQSLAVDPAGNTWAITSQFPADDPDAALTLHLIAADGSGREQMLDLVADGIEVRSGACFVSDERTGTLICDQSSGPPMAIDTATGRVIPVEGFSSGAISTVAPTFAVANGISAPACSAAAAHLGERHVADPDAGWAPLALDLQAAARDCDYDRLAALAGTDFTTSFGGPTADLASYFETADAAGGLTAELAKMLQFPATESADGTVSWPGAFGRETWAEVTEEEQQELRYLGYTDGDLNGFATFGSYVGRRAGFTPTESGYEWSFFVAGD